MNHPTVGLKVLLNDNPRPIISIICPFSREWMVDIWFDKLKELNIPFNDVGLFIYVDNNLNGLYDRILDKCVELMTLRRLNQETHRPIPDIAKIGSIKLYYSGREPITDNKNYLDRRERIATIHNDIQKHMFSKFVFGLEDDTCVDRTTFYKMYNHILEIPSAGLITACEVGRWGFEYIGAWKVNARNEFGIITDMSTVPYKEQGVIDIDAAGLYCFITRLGLYKNHNFLSYKQHEFYGPDMCYGLAIKKKNMRVLLDYDLHCEHYKDQNTILRPTDEDVCEVRFRKSNNWIAEITYAKDKRLPQQDVYERKEDSDENNS